MLWHKSWLETRSRFLFGLVLLMIIACGDVFEYPQVLKLMPMARSMDVSGDVGRLIKEAAALSAEFRGHIWLQWFRQNLTQMATLFAVLLGSGGLLAQGAGGAALFTLSLPASRTAVIGARAATGLAEVLVLAIVPSLLIPLLSPAIGESYSVLDALVHGGCVFVGASAFFSLALLLSTEFSDLWRPLLAACSVAVVLAIAELAIGDRLPFGIFHVMSAETYFRTGALPWMGMIASAAAAAALLYAATVNLARHDF